MTILYFYHNLSSICYWSKNIVCEKEEIKCKNIQEHNPNWAPIPDRLCRILIIAGSGSGITNSLFNL